MKVNQYKPSARQAVQQGDGTGAPAARQREKLMPVIDAIYKAFGYRPHISTIHRWFRRGVISNGVRVTLEAYTIGGRLLCSVEAADRFGDATNNSRNRDSEPAPTLPRSDHKRAAAVANANAKLDNAGI